MSENMGPGAPEFQPKKSKKATSADSTSPTPPAETAPGQGNGAMPPTNGGNVVVMVPGKKSNRFANFRDDQVGPEGWVPPGEPETTYATGFGPPKPGVWFRVDPRPGYSPILKFTKGKMPDSKELSDKLFYVAGDANKLPEISKKVRPYAIHSVVDSFGHRSLWPRRLPDPSRKDTWATSDSKVAEAAKTEWVRRVVDETVESGAYKAIHQPENEEPLAEPEFDDTPFEDLLDKAIPEADVIDGDGHPLIVFLRTGKLVKFTSDDK